VHCAYGLLLQSLGPSGSERVRPILAFRPRQNQGRPSPASAPTACRQNPVGQRPVVGSGVAREQASYEGGGLDFGGGRDSAHRNQAAHGVAIRAAGSGDGGAVEHLRAPARWSRGLTMSVWSLGWCHGVGEASELWSAVAQ
jgi:hypothetical protein